MHRFTIEVQTLLAVRHFMRSLFLLQASVLAARDETQRSRSCNKENDRYAYRSPSARVADSQLCKFGMKHLRLGVKTPPPRARARRFIYIKRQRARGAEGPFEGKSSPRAALNFIYIFVESDFTSYLLTRVSHARERVARFYPTSARAPAF